LESQKPILWPRLLNGLAIGFFILVFLFMPFFFSRNFRHEIGDSLVRIGEQLNGNRDAQADPSSPIPPPISNQNSMSVPAVPNTAPADSTKESSDQSGPAASIQRGQTTQDAANSADTGVADHQNSGQHSTWINARSGRSALARQLWSALRAGDASAEVPLAQLYLKGDGVPRNCEQALVLLRAASKNGNMEARQQLRQLGKRPCR